MTSNRAPERSAVITGASSGIGAATARALAADGYRIALLARRRDRITTLADELGHGAIAIEADVTDRDSIVAAADRVRQELGTAGVLVNNVGIDDRHDARRHGGMAGIRVADPPGTGRRLTAQLPPSVKQIELQEARSNDG